MASKLMQSGRRIFVSTLVAALTAGRAGFAQQRRPSPVPHLPGVPGADWPTETPGDEPPIAPNPKALLKENQKALRRDASKLVELAQELKTESEKTEETDVLSLSLIHKAEEIEKLARQIKSLASSA